MRLAISIAGLLLFNAALAAAQDDAQTLAQLGVKEAPVALREMRGWRPPKKIVVAVSDPRRLAWLRDAVGGRATAIVPAGSIAELEKAVADADGMIGPCREEVVAAGRNLRWIQTSGVGVEDCLAIPAIRDGRIELTNVQRVTAGTVAEHAMAMMLAVSRQIPVFVRQQREGRWSPRPPPNLTALEDKTLLVVGLGNVGTEIASRAHAFRMRVIGIRKEAADKRYSCSTWENLTSWRCWWVRRILSSIRLH